jgi:DNA-binding response OmpR family regulator
MERAQHATEPSEVVVVEDNRILAELIAMRLRRRGHRIRILPDGFAATGYISQAQRTGRRPTLMLVESRLPGPNGLAILEKIRRANWTIPVIMMRDPWCADLDRGAQDLGAVMLSKPFGFAQLEAIVTASLGLPLEPQTALAR